jgi:hypothetical protein
VSDVTAENHPPVVSAPATRQVDEGVALSFTVTAADADGDHVALTAGGVPAGATFSDQGNNTGLFSWTPGATQSGVYEVSFSGNDGHGGTGSSSTRITVSDVGGGGEPTVPAAACLLGHYRSRCGTTCFRIKPVHESFDPRDVVLSSITLWFRDRSIAALEGARIDVACHRSHRGGHDDDKAGESANGPRGDNDNRDYRGRCGLSCNDHRYNNDGNNHPGDDDEDDEDDDDEGEDHDGDHDRGHDGDDHHGHDRDGHHPWSHSDCDTLGVRVCFSTAALIHLFSGAALPCDLRDAEIHATLTSGATLVATFNRNGHGHDEGDDDDDQGDDHDGDDLHGSQGDGLVAQVMPNPFNPMTELSFSLSRAGHVRVTIYDLQGRVVKALVNETRSAGVQRVVWNGSNAQNQTVPSGIYFIRIETPEGKAIRKVAVVK